MQNCQDKSADYTKVKCVLIGDGAVGKTSLVISYTTNGFPTEYMPTAYDNYTVLVTVNKQPVQLQLCDTAGQDDFDLLRPLCYPNTDIFILCFSIVSPASFHNVSQKWMPEIRASGLDTPVVLVGTQSDLRTDVKVLIELSEYGERPVSEAEGKATARCIGAESYIECSALTQHNLKEVFDVAVRAVLLRCGAKNHRKWRSDRATATNGHVVRMGVSASPISAERCTAEPASAVRSWKKSLCCWT